MESSLRARRIVVLAAALLCGTAPAEPASAQQRVVLRIRPPVGDTLRMQLEQRFELTAADARGVPAGAMSGSIWVWTRAVPLRRVGSTTEILSVTDSVRVMPPSAAAWPLLRDARRALEGRTVRLTIAQNGEIEVSGGQRTGVVASRVGVDVPSVLPTEAVAPGESWKRDITVPLSATERETALVRARLRLDSLSSDGGTAYMFVRGDVWHDHAQHSTLVHGNVTGTLVGTIELDRRLGWITASRTALAIESLVQRTGEAPMRLKVRVTQSLRALVQDQ